MKKWLILLACFLVALQGASSRESSLDENSLNEYSNIHYLKTLEKRSNEPANINNAITESSTTQESYSSQSFLGVDAKELNRSPKPEHFAGINDGSLVKEPKNDIYRRSEESFDLPQNTGKPTGFSQFLSNENRKPQGVAIPRPQLLGESTGFTQLPQNAEEPKELPTKVPAGNNERKLLSAPAKTPVEENTSAKKMNSNGDEDVMVHQETKAATKAAAKNDDLQTGSVYSTSAAVVPSIQGDDTTHDRFMPTVNDPVITESDNKDETFREMRPTISEEISSDEVLIPPTSTSARFSQRGRYKLRRRRRSVDEENEDLRRSSRYRLINFNRTDDCYNELSRTVYVVLAITGWLFAALMMVVCCLKFGWICRGKCENDDTSGAHVCRCIRHMEDLESGQENQTENNQNEISIYEKHDRRPTGYCHVETIDEEDLTNIPSLTTQKETIEKESLTICPPLPPPMPKTLVFEKKENYVSTKLITKKVTFQSDKDCDMETSQRRASEKVKVIRKLSSSIGRPSLLDEIEIAQEVIMDGRSSDDKGHERRKVIKNVTANERRASLLEEIQFAKNVILPSNDDKERNENAFHRRHLIKQRSSSHRNSLLDNITMAMEVLLGAIETSV